MDLLQLKNITATIREEIILSDISFSQQPLQNIAVAGESGTGKTTLLKIIAGLFQPITGEVIFDGEKVEGPDEKLIPGHPLIAYISQHFELRNNYRVEEELDYTNQLTSAEATAIYEVCEISHLLHRWTDELSGGEKQRIVTARALIAHPKLLLLDEPFSNLDPGHKQIMKSMINNITNKLKITCILVSHDPHDTLSWAEKIIVLQKGKIIQMGTPKQIYLQPVNEYCAALFGKYNLLNKETAALFPGMIKLSDAGKRILLRPEHFKLSDKSYKNAVQVIVNKVNFVGSFQEIEVLVNGEPLLMRCAGEILSPDETLYITADDKFAHVI